MGKNAGEAPHPHDLGVAASTGGSKELSIAVLTVHIVLLLNKAHISQRHVTIVTVKLLRVPGPAKGHQEWPPEQNNNNDMLLSNKTLALSIKNVSHLMTLLQAPHRGVRLLAANLSAL